jgi:hypothetical protein
MKKIGVLTYIREYSNIGTNMQSYCTLKAIQREFPDDHIELIDYSLKRASRKPYLSNMSLNSLKNDFVRMRKYNAFFKKELSFSRTGLVTADVDKFIDFVKKQNYDAIYVGSDTVLELKGASQDNVNGYWLDPSILGIKILIAASSLNVVYESLSEEQIYKIQKSVDGFSSLGVRDDATYRLLSNFVSKGDGRLRIVPDPTFTYEIDYRFAEEYLEKRRLNIDKPIVCLHFTRDLKCAAEVSDRFRKEGFIIASLRPAKYADINFTDLTPFEQMGIYKYFNLVITHRFHDSIFCIKNHTPVIVFPEHIGDVTRYSENKNLSLLKAFDLDKTGFIENKNMISGPYLIGIYRAAIRNMNEKDSFINTVLKKKRDIYGAFVSESKKIIMG